MFIHLTSSLFTHHHGISRFKTGRPSEWQGPQKLFKLPNSLDTFPANMSCFPGHLERNHVRIFWCFRISSYSWEHVPNMPQNPFAFKMLLYRIVIFYRLKDVWCHFFSGGCFVFPTLCRIFLKNLPDICGEHPFSQLLFCIRETTSANGQRPSKTPMDGPATRIECPTMIKIHITLW